MRLIVVVWREILEWKVPVRLVISINAGSVVYSIFDIG